MSLFSSERKSPFFVRYFASQYYLSSDMQRISNRLSLVIKKTQVTGYTTNRRNQYAVESYVKAFQLLEFSVVSPTGKDYNDK
jgi:hypothetical protein